MKRKFLYILMRFFAIFVILSLLSFTETKAEHNTLTKTEKADGWILLFDGESSKGWRGCNTTEFPDDWLIEDGTLYCMGSGGDIIYDHKLLNFHLKIDWKISEGGNSGVFTDNISPN